LRAPLCAAALVGLCAVGCDEQPNGQGPAGDTVAISQSLSASELRRNAVSWLEQRVPLRRPASVGTELHTNQQALGSIIAELKAGLREDDRPGSEAADAVTLARLQVAHEALANWQQQPLPRPVAAPSPSADYLTKVEAYKKEVARFNTLNAADARALGELKRKMLGQ